MYASYKWHIWKVNDDSRDTSFVYELITNYCPNTDFLSVISKNVNFTYLQAFLLEVHRHTSVRIAVSLINIRIRCLPSAYLESYCYRNLLQNR